MFKNINKETLNLGKILRSLSATTFAHLCPVFQWSFPSTAIINNNIYHKGQKIIPNKYLTT